jgi:hypothetical protein
LLRTNPIGPPALIVAVIIIVPERITETEVAETAIVREPPTGTDVMTANLGLSHHTLAQSKGISSRVRAAGQNRRWRVSS